ncbi:phytoene desaturase family protein, partial [Streptomyces goshikiensis]|uniref:phytoene desaturase family protein n=1 Tax=Streptomyces goshikiensis TaxID=1942 RepID=UPI00365F1419
MPDAVVIGAGPNGLVAANVLVDAGWSVEVLEAQEQPGGAVRSDRGVHPDYVSDLFSSFYPLAAASPVLARLDLVAEGLRWSQAPSVLAHPLPDGRCAVLERRTADTAAGLAEFARADGDAWQDMYEVWSRVGPELVRSLFTPFPPVRAGLRLAARLRAAGGLRLARNLALPVRRLGEEQFAGEGGRLLLAGNALHADLAPEAAGSGGFGWLMSMLGQSHGFPVPVGGSGALTAALVSRFRRRGGVLRCGQRVASVVVRGGRAVGVTTAGGEGISARRAVLADTSATALYRDLVGEEHLPGRLLRDLERFQWDFATFKVDWALTGPVPWTAPRAAAAGTVHIADGIDALTRFSAQIAMGQVPDEPFALLGQMTTADPSRSPAGTESAWAYTHLPQRVTADAGPDGITGSWDTREQEAMADRLEARVERFAPGFRARIRARRILAPTTLQAMNENLHNGALNNRTPPRHQQAILR